MKAPKKKSKWRWERSRCEAHTKSEARAIFKAIHGVGRLPAGAFVVKIS